jgi:ribosomal protein S18 acetylase RimI-like enzyme
MRLTIIPSGPERERYLSLYLLADETEDLIRGYMQAGDLYLLRSESGETLGIVLATPFGDGEIELKSVAVDEPHQRQGIGKRMLTMVVDDLASKGVRRVVVGTGNSGIGQIAFYQKAGFRLWKIERDASTPEHGYSDGLEENGIPLQDRVWFDRDLP